MYVSAERQEAADYVSHRLTGSESLDPIRVIRGQLYLGELLMLHVAKANGTPTVHNPA